MAHLDAFTGGVERDAIKQRLLSGDAITEGGRGTPLGQRLRQCNVTADVGQLLQLARKLLQLCHGSILCLQHWLPWVQQESCDWARGLRTSVRDESRAKRNQPLASARN